MKRSDINFEGACWLPSLRQQGLREHMPALKLSSPHSFLGKVIIAPYRQSTYLWERKMRLTAATQTISTLNLIRFSALSTINAFFGLRTQSLITQILQPYKLKHQNTNTCSRNLQKIIVQETQGSSIFKQSSGKQKSWDQSIQFSPPRITTVST